MNARTSKQLFNTLTNAIETAAKNYSCGQLNITRLKLHKETTSWVVTLRPEENATMFYSRDTRTVMPIIMESGFNFIISDDHAGCKIMVNG